MDLYDKFKLIEAHFTALDEGKRKQDIKLHFDTAYGIWGPSSMLDVFELFGKMRLEGRKGFVDLGSGDGRIVLIAALFTDACGIEGDEKLDATANGAKAALIGQVPELSRAAFTKGDYTQADLTGFEILFTFCDHPWDPLFEKYLEERCDGVLLSYNRIFLPQRLKKGKTYWMQQVPIVSYPLGRPDSDMLARPLAPDHDEQDEHRDDDDDERVGGV